MGDRLPDIWMGNDYGDVLSFNLFDLEEVDWYLDLQSRDLNMLSGTIVKNTPACLLAVESYIEWNSSQPQTLKVYSNPPVLQCGHFNIERLKNRPETMNFLDLVI